MANVIVDLQSIRVNLPEAVVNAYLKGNPTASEEVHMTVVEALKKRIEDEPYCIVENMEIDEYDEGEQ